METDRWRDCCRGVWVGAAGSVVLAACRLPRLAALIAGREGRTVGGEAVLKAARSERERCVLVEAEREGRPHGRLLLAADGGELAAFAPHRVGLARSRDRGRDLPRRRRSGRA